MKSKSYKIEGVKPFNDFLYKSCYWHQLITGLSGLGIDKEAVLLNGFMLVGPEFTIFRESTIPWKRFEKEAGYTNVACNVDEKRLIKNIGRGNPVIVGVDCYYLESRAETYLLTHSPHFILAYGYDLEKRTANVVDHNYLNSFEYTKKVISLDNLLKANAMYAKKMTHEKTCRVLKRKRRSAGELNILSKFDPRKMEASREYSHKNLCELKRIFSGDVSVLEQNAQKITDYLRQIRMSLYCIAAAKIFREHPENEKKLSEAIYNYSNLLSLLWKMSGQRDYSFARKHLKRIERKLEETENAEAWVYEKLKEAANENI